MGDHVRTHGVGLDCVRGGGVMSFGGRNKEEGVIISIVDFFSCHKVDMS